MMDVSEPLTIVNRLDECLSERESIAENQIRSVSIKNFLVDTRKLRLYLPADLIAHLGLEFFKTIGGIGKSKPIRMYRDAKLSLYGREGTFECFEIPTGQPVIVGRVPLDALGLKPDLENSTIEVLPCTSADTYWSA